MYKTAISGEQANQSYYAWPTEMAKIIVTLLLCGLGLASSFVKATEDIQEFSTADYQRAVQMRHLAIEFFDYYGNFTMANLVLPTSERAPTQQDLLCLAELNLVSQGLSAGNLWALRLLDAWGTLPSGILYGNLKDLGNYDECININRELFAGHNLAGKYCLAKLPVGQMLGAGSGLLSILGVKTAVCFPASCTGAHMNIMLHQLFNQLLNIKLDPNVELVDDAGCSTSEKEPLDGLAIFTIVLLSLLGAAMFLATLYDYFLCQDQSQLPPLVKAFSARANSRVLFRVVDSKTNPNVIDCLHGIRCMSLIWVIYGHEYMNAIFLSPNINLVHAYSWLESPYSMLIQHGLFSVDSFFFLSGLLVVMVALRAMEKQKGKLNVPLMYLHRYLRLTPVLAIAILVYMKVLPLLGDGPLWNSTDLFEYSSCESTWYYTLLYVQNYACPNNMCLSHAWYLAVDMQLYIIAPILLIALYKWGKKAAGGILLFMLLLSACLFSMMVIKGYSFLSPNNYKIYYTTQTRAAPWLIGILFGYFLHLNRGRTFKLSQLTVWLGWLLCLATMFASIFALYPSHQWSTPSLPILNEAFFMTLTRIAWPLALCWVVFACMQGYGGLANSFLSSYLWQPLSKLSYCAYIFHMLIEHMNAKRTHTNTYFSDYQIMLRLWYDFGFTLLLSYFMYILVEAPLGGVESMLLPNRRPSPKPTALSPAQIDEPISKSVSD